MSVFHNQGITMTDLAGNIPAQARDRDIFSQRLLGTVSNLGDTNNFYKFSLSGSSTVNLSLTTETSSVGLDVIHDTNSNEQIDTGEIISSQIINANSQFNNGINLESGQYFVRVWYVNGEEAAYALNLQQNSAGNSTIDLAGNTFSSARIIEFARNRSISGDSLSTYSDWVDKSDRTDIYEFTLDTNAIAELKATGLSGDIGLRLYNSAGNEIDTSSLINQAREGLTRLLPSGTYYIAVDAPFTGAGTQYNLEFAVTSYSEPGNEVFTAQTLPISLIPSSDPSMMRGRTFLEDAIGGGDIDTWKIVGNFNPGSNLTIGSSTLNLRNINTVNLDFKLFQDLNRNNQLDTGEEITPSRFDYNSFFATWKFNNLRDRALGDYYIQASSNSQNSFNYSFNATLDQITTPQTLSIPLQPTSDSTVLRGSVTTNGSVSARSRNIWKIENPMTPDSKLTINSNGINLLNVDVNNLELKIFQDTNNNYTIDVGEEIPVTKFDYNSLFATWEFGNIAHPQQGNYYLMITSKSEDLLNYSFTATLDEIIASS
jgi:Bacterial pre-peptidase C-terminal domain